MFKSALLAAAATLALAVPATASAAILLYELTLVAGGNSGYSFRFQLDTTRTPSFQISESLRYAPTTITYTLPGSATVYTDTISNLGPSFFAPIQQGGISIARLPRGNDLQPRFFQAPGGSLYTGPSTNPTFLTGTFALSTMPKNVPTDVQIFNYQIRVTDVGAVPEPATWAMMIGGFGAIGGAMRYRRRKTSVVFS